MNGQGDNGVGAAMTAGMNERANRPKHFLFLGVLVLVGATIFLFMSYRKVSGAKKELQRAHNQHRGLVRTINQIDGLAEDNRGVSPDARAKTKIEAKAREAGLTITVDEKTDGVGTDVLKTKTFTAEVKQADPAAFLEWLTDVMYDPIDLPGMEIQFLKLTRERSRTPDQGGWSARVVFTREEAVR